MHKIEFVWGNGLYQVGQFIFTTLSWSVLYRFFFNDHLLANSSVEYSEKTFFEGAGAKKNLSVPLDETLVLRRIVELPSGVDREVLLVDLRWTDVHDLGGVANLVSSWPFSPWRIWMGFVLSDDDVLVLPIPLPCHVLEEAV